MTDNYQAYMKVDFSQKAPWSWVALLDGKEVANEADYKTTLDKALELFPGSEPSMPPIIPEDDFFFF